jgi:hypothetical protein
VSGPLNNSIKCVVQASVLALAGTWPSYALVCPTVTQTAEPCAKEIPDIPVLICYCTADKTGFPLQGVFQYSKLHAGTGCCNCWGHRLHRRNECFVFLTSILTQIFKAVKWTLFLCRKHTPLFLARSYYGPRQRALHFRGQASRPHFYPVYKVSREEVHKLKDRIHKLIWNTRKDYRIVGVRSSRG